MTEPCKRNEGRVPNSSGLYDPKIYLFGKVSPPSSERTSPTNRTSLSCGKPDKVCPASIDGSLMTTKCGSSGLQKWPQGRIYTNKNSFIVLRSQIVKLIGKIWPSGNQEGRFIVKGSTQYSNIRILDDF
jgi:hypothetical protein